MIHRDVVESHGPDLIPGTALVIKELQVIMTLRGHHVIVTMDNLSCLYPRNAACQAGPGPCGASSVRRLSRADLDRIVLASERFEKEQLARIAAESTAAATPMTPRPVTPRLKTEKIYFIIVLANLPFCFQFSLRSVSHFHAGGVIHAPRNAPATAATSTTATTTAAAFAQILHIQEAFLHYRVD